MSRFFFNTVKEDLAEARIGWKVALAFIPIAFFTYFFHESGHWIFGELTGNRMTFGLNSSATKSGFFITDTDALWSATGGPLFTILLALTALMITRKTKSVYAWSVMFFAGFTRFFSILLGGLGKQDEARIASLLHVNPYFVASVVLIILFLIIWSGSRRMKMSLKTIGYFTVLSTAAMLVVIAADRIW